MPDLLTATNPSNYFTAAALTLVVPLSVLLIVLAWWTWAARRRS